MAAIDEQYWCVVPAAGHGHRFGSDIPKQYLPLAGKPLLLQTLERLASHPCIAGLMVVLAVQDKHWPNVRQICAKPVVTAIGGGERADSVLAGLLALREHASMQQFVLVHDAARPFVINEDISRLIELGVPANGALLAAPLRDTLKRADANNRSVVTESRESRWRALTPQLFRLGELIDALQAASADGIVATDESMAMERVGHRPLLVDGSEGNIKITTRADMALAEFLFARLEQKN